MGNKNTSIVIEEILKEDVHFHFSKSGGHGGQNVNKRNTKAELYFNIQDTIHLTDDQRQRLIKLAGHQVHHHEGILIMTCQEERYQHANKAKVIHHFKQLLERAFIKPQKRIATKLPKYKKEKRSEDKKRHSLKKSNRKNSELENL